VIHKQGKVMKADFGATKPTEELLYLFTDILISATENKGIKMKSLVHLSSVRVMSSEEAHRNLGPDSDWGHAVRGRDDKCIVICSRQSNFVLIANNKTHFDEWLSALKECSDDTQSQHQERVQNLEQGTGSVDEDSKSSQKNNCKLCIKGFGMFQKQITCASCKHVVCGNCSSAKSVCDACDLMERKKTKKL
jgi:hypothetical protein